VITTFAALFRSLPADESPDWVALSRDLRADCAAADAEARHAFHLAVSALGPTYAAAARSGDMARCVELVQLEMERTVARVTAAIDAVSREAMVDGPRAHAVSVGAAEQEGFDAVASL
jgi:N-acyl-L-homoserine lactone synthetase